MENQPSRDFLRAAARSALSSSGISLDQLEKEASQVVVFGSWAAGLQRPSSDVDLLCVGNGKRMKKRRVDLVWLSPASRFHERWLGSELANHIAKWGVWVVGEDDWSDRVFISERSIAFKRRLIERRAEKLALRWRFLADEYRRKHVVKLRRDIQRLDSMLGGDPVEPTALLDASWTTLQDIPALQSMAAGANVQIRDEHWARFADHLSAPSW